MRSPGIEEWPDDKLVTEFQATGDPEIFGILFVRHRRSVLMLCQRVVHDRTVAEDLLHDTFLRAFRNMHRYRSGSIVGWLRTIAAHLAFNHLRRVIALHETTMPADETRLHLGGRLDPSFKIGILEILEQIPSHMQKACLKLFYIEGLECKEIAEYLGISQNAVKSHIQNGRRQLRQRWLATAAGAGEQP